jgi:hypothetical protein
MCDQNSAERVTLHYLKINRQPFEELMSGAKTGEVRFCADRAFKVGDDVILREMTEASDTVFALTGREMRRTITHIQRGYGLPDHLCVLSYATLRTEQAATVPDGWKLVPVNDTDVMMTAAYAVAEARGDRVSLVLIGEIYRAMLAAAPPVPARVVMTEQLTGKNLYAMWVAASGLGCDPWEVLAFEHDGWNGLADRLNGLNTKGEGV